MKAGIDRDRIDPEFLMDLSDPIESVYAAIEHDLLVNIARHFQGGTDDIAYSLAWESKMLAQIGKLTDESIRIIAAYTGDVSGATLLAIRTAIETGIGSIEPELAKIVAKPAYVPERTSFVTQIVNAYQAQTINHLNMVNTVMLNSSLNAYRKTVNAASSDYEARLAKAQATLNEETGQVITGAKTRQEAVNDAVKRMATDGLTGYTDARGRSWNPQAYVNMDIRTTTANAAREATMQRAQQFGSKLIEVSSHMGARPKCEPYQGRIFSTDGTSGTARDLNGKPIPYTPLSATSYGQPDGLFGINCGHVPYPFIDGVSIQSNKPYDKTANDAQYQRLQMQRYMERQVRASKTRADVLEAAGDADSAKELRRKARADNAELRKWCEENGMDYKPDRVRIVKTGDIIKKIKEAQ